jgi:FkbM family methyltransferase
MSRTTRYLRELRFAWQCADGLRSGLTLGLATLAFHAGNLVRPKPSRRPRAYSVRVGSTVHDLRLRTHGGDLFVFYEVLLDRCYRLPKRLAASPPTIVDLGANVGLTSLYYAGEYPGARIVCVEPDPENAALLRHNLQRLGERGTVVEAAAASRLGPVFLSAGGGTWGRFVAEEGSGARSVEGITIPRLMELHGIDRIDLLKVDIEGSERDLFADCSSWIDAVSAIIIELHGEYSVDHFRRDLSSSGLSVLAPDGPSGEAAMVMAVRR